MLKNIEKKTVAIIVVGLLCGSMLGMKIGELVFSNEQLPLMDIALQESALRANRMEIEAIKQYPLAPKIKNTWRKIIHASSMFQLTMVEITANESAMIYVPKLPTKLAKVTGKTIDVLAFGWLVSDISPVQLQTLVVQSGGQASLELSLSGRSE